MPFRFRVLCGARKQLTFRTQALRAAGRLVLLMTLALPLTAQIPGFQAPTTPGSQQEPAADPLGRRTPRGTITGFIVAVHRNDFVSAASYMQIVPAQRSNADSLAQDLSELMDRYLTQIVTSISDSPNGAVNDGLPLDQERIGPLAIGGKNVDIVLVHITDKKAGPIWLISKETLAQVPGLRRSLAKTWVERVMPERLQRHSVLGLTLAQWLAVASSLIVPFLLMALLARLLLLLGLKTLKDPAKLKNAGEWFTTLRWPVVVVGTLSIHLLSLLVVGVPISFRLVYGRVGFVVWVIALAWLLRRLSSTSFEHVRRLMDGKGQTGTRSLLLLAERLTNVVIILVMIFMVLTTAGVDTGTALAGVGIGGIAVALGAQKTVENLLGGIFLLTDKVLAVGDTCSISDRVGVIEDITLRSVRMRTVQQTLLSIPAGVLAQASIENFATRSKILAQTTLRLKYSTSVQQLRTVLVGIRRLLLENPHIETETCRIRLVGFGERAIELELFAYVLTSDLLIFLAIREELLLKVAEVVEGSGTGFALPTDVIPSATVLLDKP
jgi:MscS family membrane protein